MDDFESLDFDNKFTQTINQKLFVNDYDILQDQISMLEYENEKLLKIIKTHGSKTFVDRLMEKMNNCFCFKNNI